LLSVASAFKARFGGPYFFDLRPRCTARDRPGAAAPGAIFVRFSSLMKHDLSENRFTLFRIML
jgi:hypothetical protein